MPQMLHPKKTQKYSEEFKSKAVQLSLFPEVKVKDVAKTLDIHAVTMEERISRGKASG